MNAPRVLIVMSMLVLTGIAPAQFTGNVLNDFPPVDRYMDPGGQDSLLPGTFPPGSSGWDIRNVGIRYDVDNDILNVGIDTYRIAGDADGDGNPAGTSAPLTALGGVDQPDFGGTETFVFGLDLDDDGTLDIVAGVPMGSDITGYTVASFNDFPGALSNPSAAFGAGLPMNTGSVFASPSTGAPDLEFSITNLSHLTVMHYQAGQTQFGYYAFMGSMDDATIGDDQVPGNGMIAQLDISEIECFPAPNYVTVVNISMEPTGRRIVVSYGSMAGYGCCVLVSHDLDLAGKVLPVLGNPVVNLGLPGDFSTIIVQDRGSNNIPGRPVTCKELNGLVPYSVPSGTQFHLQFLTYPIVFGTNPFLTSNVYTFIQP